MRFNSAFKQGLCNSLSHSSGSKTTFGKNWIIVLRKGSAPNTPQTLDSLLNTISGNWATSDSNFLCAFKAVTSNASPTFSLGNFTPFTDSGISTGLNTCVSGIATHAILFPADASFLSTTGGYPLGFANGYGNAARADVKGNTDRILVNYPTDINTSGQTGRAICLVVSVGVTGSSDPLTLINTTIITGVWPSITACIFTIS